MINKSLENPMCQYQLLEKLGEGTFGKYYYAADKIDGSKVVIKKLSHFFDDIDQAKGAYVEVMALQGLQGHENIVQLKSVIKSKNRKGIRLVFEYVQNNLNNYYMLDKKLEQAQRQNIMYQLLKTLKYLHSAGLIHANLQPSKILIDKNGTIKLSGFDNVRTLHPTNASVNYEMVGYREFMIPYQPPEIIMGSQKYSTTVDIWAVGCILGELIIGKRTFLRSLDRMHIDELILLLGRPSPEDIEAICIPSAARTLRILREAQEETFESFFVGGSKEEIDLLKRILVYNPYDRITADEALNHVYFKQFVDKGKVSENIITIDLDDVTKLSAEGNREAFFKEMNKGKIIP